MSSFSVICAEMYSIVTLPSYIRWAFNVTDWNPTFKEWLLAMQCVHREEKDRILRFVYPKDAKSSLIGRLLMRKVSKDFTGIPYNKIQFSRSEAGKPFISNNFDATHKINFHFNVSHNGDFCVLAAESERQVGIDVMKIEYRGHRPVPEYFKLMSKQFSNEEMNFITSPGSEAEQLSRFYRIWCLKESFVKADGTGISRNLSSISFHCPTAFVNQQEITTDTNLNLEGTLSKNWKFEETLLDENHCIAVAIETKDEEKIDNNEKLVPFTIFNFDDLMTNSVPFETATENDKSYYNVLLNPP